MVDAAGSPPTLVWGAAASAQSTLGIAPRSTWAPWEGNGRLPLSGEGSGFGVDFRADLAQAAELGLRAFRWTFDWARLEPWEGRWDGEAVDLITEVLRAARECGIEVWAVLHDGALPGWFADDRNGFDDDTGLRRIWPRHVDRVAETFGEYVDTWVPVLDPFTIAMTGNLDGTRPPGHRSEQEFVDHLLALHLASYEALRLLTSGDALVACCIDTEPTYGGVHSREPDERIAASERATRIDRMRLGSWIRALRDGVVSVPGLAERELPGLAGGYDIIGFTQRNARTVFADGTDGPYPADAIPAADGNAPWAEGLGLTLRTLADAELHRPLALLGTGLVAHEDARRIETLQAIALELGRAIDDGVELTHAFWETAIDGWTPQCGLTAPTGFIDRDRNPRPSAAVMRELAGGSARLSP